MKSDFMEAKSFLGRFVAAARRRTYCRPLTGAASGPTGI
jgi:hypothetical protein